MIDERDYGLWQRSTKICSITTTKQSNSHPRTPLGALVGVSIGLPVFGARGVAGVGVGVGEVESVINSCNNASQPQLVFSQSSCRKSYVLDIITILKNMHSFDNENYLVIASTGNVFSTISESTLHLCKKIITNSTQKI